MSLVDFECFFGVTSVDRISSISQYSNEGAFDSVRGFWSPHRPLPTPCHDPYFSIFPPILALSIRPSHGLYHLKAGPFRWLSLNSRRSHRSRGWPLSAFLWISFICLSTIFKFGRLYVLNTPLGIALMTFSHTSLKDFFLFSCLALCLLTRRTALTRILFWEGTRVNPRSFLCCASRALFGCVPLASGSSICVGAVERFKVKNFGVGWVFPVGLGCSCG